MVVAVTQTVYSNMLLLPVYWITLFLFNTEQLCFVDNFYEIVTSFKDNISDICIIIETYLAC